jgi:hypothetical protein
VSLVLFVSLTPALGCQKAAKPATTGVVPTYNAQTGRLERISYDRNKDGKPDAWLHMDGTRATRSELDENYDGAVDRWEEYQGDVTAAAPGGAVPRSDLVRAEQSTQFDGKVNRWERYQDGRLATVEEDTTGDGRPDKWETWVDGSLAEVALDTRNAGKPDRRLVYPADGGEPQLLIDSGDGSFRPATTEP